MENNIRFELWKSKADESYTLLEEIVKNPTKDEQRRYNFMTSDSILITTFKCKDFEAALEMRDRYLGWK